MLPPKLWQGIHNNTIQHRLKDTNSNVPTLTQSALDDLTAYQKALGEDVTKTKGLKAKLMAQRVQTHINAISKMMGDETTAALNDHNTLNKRVQAYSKFDKSDHMFMAARWLDVIQNEDQLRSLMSREPQVAKLVLNDPVTRYKFEVGEADEKAAYETCVRGALLPEEINRMRASKAHADTLNDFAVEIGAMSDNVTRVLNEIIVSEV